MALAINSSVDGVISITLHRTRQAKAVAAVSSDPVIIRVALLAGVLRMTKKGFRVAAASVRQAVRLEGDQALLIHGTGTTHPQMRLHLAPSIQDILVDFLCPNQTKYQNVTLHIFYDSREIFNVCE